MQQPYGYQENAKSLSHTCTYLAFGCVVMMIIMQALGVLLIVGMRLVFPMIATTQLCLNLISAISFYGVGIPVFYLIVKTIPAAPKQQKLRMRIDEIMTWAVISLGGMYIFNYFSVWLNEIISFIKGSPVINPVVSATENIWITIVFSVILAPIFEEFVFRGIILNRLKPYGDKVSIFFSALLFAMFHGNLYQMFYAFAIGCAFAYVALRTRRIAYTIGLHMFVNFCGGVLFPQLASSSHEIVTALMGMFVIVLMISAIVLFVVNFYRFRRLDSGLPIYGKSKIALSLCNPGMAVYAAATLVLVLVNIFA